MEKYLLAIVFGTLLGLSFAAVEGYVTTVNTGISSNLS